MKKNIYIVKKVLIDNGEFEALKVKGFLSEEAALNYILNEANRYENNASEHPKMKVERDGFTLMVHNYHEVIDILYSMEVTQIDSSTGIIEDLFVYTEVNEYTDGELFFYAKGYLTEADVKREMRLDVEHRIKMFKKPYSIVSGSVEDNRINLKDRDGNTSYLECIKIKINQ